MRGEAGDAAEVEPFQRAGVGGSKEGADVVEAADVIEEDSDGEGADAVVGRGKMGGGEGKSFVWHVAVYGAPGIGGAP